MPYIKQSDRSRFQVLLRQIEREHVGSAGDLNFLITMLCQAYMRYHHGEQPVGYKTLNEIVGALECAKQEFYRRVVVPYEDRKIEENGDVF